MRLRQRLVTRWRNRSLWVRLALGFGALVALMVVVVMLAITQFRSLTSKAEQAMGQDLQRMLQVQQIGHHAQGYGSAMALLLTSPRIDRERIYPVVDAEYAAIDRLLAEQSQEISDPESLRLLAEVGLRRTQYRDVFFDVVTSIEAGDQTKASSTFYGAGQPALRSLLNASDALLASEQAAVSANQRAMRAQIGESEWQLAGLATLALLLAALLAWRTTQRVAKPLRLVEAAAQKIAAGDYSAKVKVQGNDELGKMAQAMNAMALAVASREADIERLAYIDRLTGLPNRTMLRRLARDLAPNELSLIMMDVARLRTVNEILGFEAGDSLLIQIAKRLQTVVAPQLEQGRDQVLARLAGGVFMVLCVEMDRSSVEQLRARIDDVVSAPMECNGQPVDVQLVYGLSDALSVPGMDATGLLLRAELAIGECKRLKRTWAWHVPVDDRLRARQLSLLSSLRKSAAAGELEMWLQPKQCLRSGQILGMEGLVRWRHPERGLISPDEFIPFAERTGHIGVVTRTMIEAALITLARWQQPCPHLSIAVNVSTLDIRDALFVDHVRERALQHQVPLANLRLEITESSLMEDAQRVLPVLNALRGLGIQLSIDDFGTGYSSLAYLNRLPVGELKIDRSFVAGADLQPSAQALLRTIIDLGHNLGMVVTAEGVETAGELALLAQLGCDQAQGYLIGKPMDPAAAQRFVTALATEPSPRWQRERLATGPSAGK